MRIWIDGQHLQTAGEGQDASRYALSLIRALSAYSGAEPLISFNAAMPDEALEAQELVRHLIERKNIHVWQSVAEGPEGETGPTSLRRFSELVLAHHISCLTPDFALSINPFDGIANKAVPLLQRFRHDFGVLALVPSLGLSNNETSFRGKAAHTRRLSLLQRMDLLLAPSASAEAEVRSSALDLPTLAVPALSMDGEGESDKIAAQTIRARLDTLAAHAHAKPHRTRDELRRKTAANLGNVHSKLAATVLAAAEPRPTAPARLFVDVTITAAHDHGTGIQRVVKKIGRHLASASGQEKFEKILVHHDPAGGFRRVDNSDGAFAMPGPDSQPFWLAPGDHILMLDSNWDASSSLLPLLSEARLRGCDVTSTLYDLVPLQVPAFCHPGMPGVFADWLKSALAYSNGFVCISKAVADDLVRLLEAIRYPRPMRIGYWRLGADIGVATDSPPASLPTGESPLFLAVGTIEPRKGHRIILEAFDALWAEGVDVTLCVAGRKGWNTQHLIDRFCAHPEFGKRLIWKEAPTDAELSALYNQCRALVAASYTEGFGLPIVEAIHHGKPVIASDIEVFKEVAGAYESASFFETGSPPALAEAVKLFLKNAPQVTDADSQHWSTWQDSADELRRIIETDTWYKTYRPDPSHAEARGIGQLHLDDEVADDDRRHKIEVTEGPITQIDGAIRYIVRVTNLSDILWSSNRERGGQLGMFLSYRLVDGFDEFLPAEGALTPIPLVLGPGGMLYAAVEIGAGQLQSATAVKIFLRQEGVAWWGDGLQAPLHG